MEDEDLASLHRAGAEAWPELALDLARFREAVRARVTRADEVRAGDLYLAVACQLGDAAAIAAFERALIPPLRRIVAKAAKDDLVLDDVMQAMRVRVLVGEAGQEARIARYEGRGSLLSWLKVIALRILTDQKREVRRIVPVSTISDLPPGLTLAPDALLLDRQWGPILKGGLAEAMRTLEPRERTLLRLHYVDGVVLERIGTMYGVNKSTVSRWLTAARERLLAGAIAAVRSSLGGGADHDIESLCVKLIDRLELSLSALYSAGAAAG